MHAAVIVSIKLQKTSKIETGHVGYLMMTVVMSKNNGKPITVNLISNRKFKIEGGNSTNRF